MKINVLRNKWSEKVIIGRFNNIKWQKCKQEFSTYWGIINDSKDRTNYEMLYYDMRPLADKLLCVVLI